MFLLLIFVFFIVTLWWYFFFYCYCYCLDCFYYYEVNVVKTVEIFIWNYISRCSLAIIWHDSFPLIQFSPNNSILFLSSFFLYLQWFLQHMVLVFNCFFAALLHLFFHNISFNFLLHDFISSSFHLSPYDFYFFRKINNKMRCLISKRGFHFVLHLNIPLFCTYVQII